MFCLHSPSCFLLPIRTQISVRQTEADWGVRSNLQYVDYSYSSLPHKMVHARKTHTFGSSAVFGVCNRPFAERRVGNMASPFKRGEGAGRNSERDADLKKINCNPATSPQLLSHHGDSVLYLLKSVPPGPQCLSVHTGSQACQSQVELHSDSMQHSLNSRKPCQILGRGFLQGAATGSGEGRQYCVFKNQTKNAP